MSSTTKVIERVSKLNDDITKEIIEYKNSSNTFTDRRVVFFASLICAMTVIFVFYCVHFSLGIRATEEFENYLSTSEKIDGTMRLVQDMNMIIIPIVHGSLSLICLGLISIATLKTDLKSGKMKKLFIDLLKMVMVCAFTAFGYIMTFIMQLNTYHFVKEHYTKLNAVLFLVLTSALGMLITIVTLVFTLTQFKGVATSLMGVKIFLQILIAVFPVILSSGLIPVWMSSYGDLNCNIDELYSDYCGRLGENDRSKVKDYIAQLISPSQPPPSS